MLTFGWCGWGVFRGDIFVCPLGIIFIIIVWGTCRNVPSGIVLQLLRDLDAVGPQQLECKIQSSAGSFLLCLKGDGDGGAADWVSAETSGL